MSAHAITNAPIELCLHTKDGDTIEFKMYPLVDADIVELDGWVQTRYIAMTRDSLYNTGVEPGSEEWRLEMSAAREEAFQLGFLTVGGAAAMATVDGLTQIILQSSHDETLDRVELRTALFNPANVELVNDALTSFNANKKRSGRPTGKKSNRKRKHKSKRKG